METWAAQLRESRRRCFRGRETETRCFDALLRQSGRPQHLLHVWGPHGVGKTMLLHEWNYRAHDRELRTHWINAAAIDDPRARLRSRGAADVLFIDALDAWSTELQWLGEQFLPSLPTTTRVVSAGRDPLPPPWRRDPGWQELMIELELQPWEASSPEPQARPPIALRTALREALGNLHRRDRLAGNRLHALVPSGDTGHGAQALHRFLVDAIDQLGDVGADGSARRILRATFLEEPRKQSAIAAELGMGYSTYRKHLRAAVDRLCYEVHARCDARVHTGDTQPAASSHSNTTVVR